MPAMINETQEEKQVPNAIAIETTATIETPYIPEESEDKMENVVMEEKKIEFKEEEVNVIKPVHDELADFIEDDAIWDLKMDEMRI